MNPSLSVILPVSNAEEVLGQVVSGLLDTIPDLIGSFEILIVDDASTDHTPEIADEWHRTYPQVRFVRHGWSWGTAAAVRTGRLACRGQHVIVISSLDDFHPRDIVRQWQFLASGGGTVARSTLIEGGTSQPQLLHRAESAHGQTRRQRSPSFLRHLRQLSGVP